MSLYAIRQVNYSFSNMKKVNDLQSKERKALSENFRQGDSDTSPTFAFDEMSRFS
jgi:hypothetical protein